MIHIGVGHVLLALVAAAGAGAPSAYAAATVPALAAPAAAVPAQEPSTARPCGPEPRDAAGWTRLFGSASGAWAGGDGASSTRLPDGRLLWVFGDTFTGSVDPTGVRGRDAGMVRNSIVVTDGACWASAVPGRDALPGRDGTWLWPTHSVVAHDGDPATLAVFAQRMSVDPGDALGFRRVGASVVSVTVPADGAPRVGTVRDLPASDVLWGAALARDGRDLWVYGTRPRPGAMGRDLLLARAPVEGAADVRTWSYRTATGWSRRPSEPAVVLRAGVSTVLAARATTQGVVLVTKPGEFLDDRVVSLTSGRAWGPWTSRVLLLAPSTPTGFAYAPGLVASRRGSRDVVVVSRTSAALEVMMRDAQASMPTFHDVGRLPR